MIEGPYIAEAAALIGDPSRATMLSALMDGRALTATELAYSSGITPQTASGHLGRLTQARLVEVEKQGRHRYYRLANAHVAHALEALMNLAVHGPPRHRPTGPRDEAMRFARTCYDHLAGRVGVALAQSLLKSGILEERNGAFEITANGEARLEKLGLDLASLNKGRRAVASRCLDWSERMPHLGGALGAVLLKELEAREWLLRVDGTRAVTLTKSGKAGLRRNFGISLD
ncbi:MAG TPA: transcriptional regulator [Rhizobiales bacterium]|nr:transcriptional regulator [Hyphomicrobiales bacterium]